MKINISQVRQDIGGRQPFRFSRPVREVVASQDDFWLKGDILVDGEVVNDGRVLNVSGKISGIADTSCHRCLKEFQMPVEVSFAENYQSQDNRDSSDDESDRVFYSGDEIDLTQLVRETLLLSEPLKIVCTEDCKGLCLKCGADLNVAPCECDRNVIDPRLAPLKQLLDKA